MGLLTPDELAGNVEDDNDKVLITKKRLAELEYDSAVLDYMLEYDYQACEAIYECAREVFTQEDINNGEYECKKD